MTQSYVAVDDSETPQSGVGYQIHNAGAPASIPVSGDNVPVILWLKASWNLVGPGSCSKTTASLPDSITGGPAEWRDDGNQNVLTDNMLPGNAYWLFSEITQLIDLNCAD